MKSILTAEKNTRGALDPEIGDELLAALPEALAKELIALDAKKVDEIRIRCGGLCAVTSNGKSIKLNSCIDRRDIDETVKKMCDGSLYAFRDTIRKGYITMRGGIRVGICGRAVMEKESVSGIYDVSALCIRIPHNIEGIGLPVCRIIRSGGHGGLLIYSPPGVGKTTLLKAVIRELAGGESPLRLAVVDTRGELCAKLPTELSVDMLTGYPKGVGIEIAARTLNPELIVCDEISSDTDEIRSIKAAHNCGVPLLASAHAENVAGLLRRTGMAALHEARIFDAYVGIKRGNAKDFRYDVTPYERANLI